MRVSASSSGLYQMDDDEDDDDDGSGENWKGSSLVVFWIED